MNGIFGVGPLEVILVLVIVLLVFGPERLPELTRNLGSMIRKLKETYVAFVTEFKDEIAPIATEIDAVTRDLRNDLSAIREAADIRGLIPSITDTDIGAGTNTVPTLLPAASTPVIAEPVQTIAPPAISQNTNGAHAPSNGHVATTTPAKVDLNDDNPWANIGVQIRTDKLDDDNPWAL